MTTPPVEVTFETAVARSLAGQDVGRELTRLEKAAVAKKLSERGFTDRSIALHLDVHEGTVHRLIHGRPAKAAAAYCAETKE